MYFTARVITDKSYSKIRANNNNTWKTNAKRKKVTFFEKESRY